MENIKIKEHLYDFLIKANDFQFKIAKEFIEGVKRGLLPGYYNEWLLNLPPKERARHGLEADYAKVETSYLESKTPKYKRNYIGPGKEELCSKFEDAYKKQELARLRLERRKQGL